MPTLRQKKASKLVENGRTMGEVMVEAGYSPITATHPTKLTESKGWQQLMDKYLPDDEILAVHKRALHATKIHGSLTEPDKEVLDIPTQLKAVELGYKIKHKVGPETLQQVSVGGDMTLEFIGGEKNV